MKPKSTIILLTVCCALLVATNSCNARSSRNAGDGLATAEPVASVPQEMTTLVTDASSTELQAVSAKRTLIVYFSPANSDTTDAVSSATPRVGNVSTVQFIADSIANHVDADVAQIVPVSAYPLPYRDAADAAKTEADKDARPAFTLAVNPQDYDTIFVGYPIWWYKMPMVMYTFFDTYDFSGKTLVPFNTHQGSRDGGTYAAIAKLEPGATVLDGLAVNGGRADDAAGSVVAWLESIGIKK